LSRPLVVRRVLVTGADTVAGSHLVIALEADSSIEAVVGLGTADAVAPFARARYRKVDPDYPSLARVFEEEEVDTVAHLFVATSSTRRSSRRLHEINVIASMNLLAAAGRPDTSVRHLVMRSSTLVYGSGPRDPAFFAEDAPRPVAPASVLEASFAEAEDLAAQFAAENPATSVAVLRIADVVGVDASNPITRNLSRRFSPCLLGFDPLVQFVDQTDAVRALAHATTQGSRGTFNVAGDGVQPFSEVAATCGTRLVPVPPIKPSMAVAPLVRLGLLEFPPELVGLLRYGRGVKNAKLVQTGFAYRYTSAQAVERFGLSVRDARRAPLSTGPPTDPTAPPDGSPIPPR